MRVDPDTDRLWYATPTAPCGATISHSGDEGATWYTIPNIGCPAQGGVALIEGPAPQGTPAPEGYPHIVYYCANSQDGDESFLACHRSCEMDQIGLAVSDDQGESWTLPAAVEVEIQDLYPPAMAIDADGDLFIAFKGPKGLPYITVSEDRGAT